MSTKFRVCEETYRHGLFKHMCFHPVNQNRKHSREEAKGDGHHVILPVPGSRRKELKCHVAKTENKKPRKQTLNKRENHEIKHRMHND